MTGRAEIKVGTNCLVCTNTKYQLGSETFNQLAPSFFINPTASLIIPIKIT